eukprot:scaffold209907_cov23-Cyclotella_meneghiniana.AAC.1
MALMEKASRKRATGSTNMNSVSSRSHAICTLNVTIAPRSVDNDDGEDGRDDNENDYNNSSNSSSSSRDVIKAKLTLVDLAGSERIK